MQALLTRHSILIFICSFFLCNGLIAQTGIDSLLGKHVNPKFEEQKRRSERNWGMDFQLFGTSAHFAKKVNPAFYIGIEAGLLPNLVDWVVLAGLQFTEENTLWSSDDRHAAENDIDQVAFFSLLGRWKPEKRKHEIDGGLKFALYAQPGSPGIDGLGLVNYYGGYFKGLYGGDRFKAGVQLDFGRAKGNNYGTFREFIIIGSPVVRFNFGRRY